MGSLERSGILERLQPGQMETSYSTTGERVWVQPVLLTQDKRHMAGMGLAWVKRASGVVKFS